MKTLSSAEVQSRFGSIANLVKAGEPVAVTQYGTPTLMILPYALAEEALRSHRARQLVSFMDAMAESEASTSHESPELTLEQINALIHELRP